MLLGRGRQKSALFHSSSPKNEPAVSTAGSFDIAVFAISGGGGIDRGMDLRGVHHVSINVGDVESAARFYTQVLEMEPLPRPDFGFPGMWLRCGGQEIHLIQVANHVAPKGQHFALRVDDIEATRRALRDKGIEVSDVIDIPGAGRQVFLYDPAGNMIELNQPN